MIKIVFLTAAAYNRPNRFESNLQCNHIEKGLWNVNEKRKLPIVNW